MLRDPLFCLTAVYLTLVDFVFTSHSPLTLQLVHMLYRHADRSPIHSFPTNPIPMSVWPQGPGFLTKRGVQQHYELGRFMRNYYSGFINKTFRHEEISIRSTDVPRTIMSAQAHLAGLFPPSGFQEWSKDIHWQPIPIHVPPLLSDYLLSKAPCPKRDEEFTRLMESADTHAYARKHQKLFETLTAKTGMTVNMTNINQLNDALLCPRLHNYSNPDWAVPLIDEIYTVSVYRSVYLWANQKVARLSAGLLLQTVIDNMVNKSDETNSSPVKMFMYSAHDTNIVPFYQTMTDYDLQEKPPYAATLIVELHRDPDGKYFVMVLYKNSTEDPHLLTVRGCSVKCPLSRFIEVTKPYACKDAAEECGSLSGKETHLLNIIYILLGVIAAAFLIISVLVVVLLLRHLGKRRHGQQYFPINIEDEME